jgi:channel protein (hemolysin III family)
VKPRLRGVSHQWAFFVSLLTGAALVIAAPAGRATFAAAVYAASVAALFGTSALYHRITWASHAARRWMRRLDHSMIFLLIAGTYTPFALLVLDGTLATVILALVWGGAAAGILLKLVWLDAPKPLVAAVYVILGWVALAAFPDLIGNRRRRHGGCRRHPLHPGRGGLRAQAAGSRAHGFRLPRGLPRARDRRGRAAVRGRGVFGGPGRLDAAPDGGA